MDVVSHTVISELIMYNWFEENLLDYVRIFTQLEKTHNCVYECMHARTIQRVKETQVNLWDMHAYNYCSGVDIHMAQLIYIVNTYVVELIHMPTVD